MTKSTAYLSQKWAATIVQELTHHNIQHFFIAPGSRSTSLAYEIAKKKRNSSTVFFDERSLGFQALGYAKASNSPVAVVVTSGTACGNLMPAIMEAYESQVPLYILTTDRPYELKFCAENQATEHQGKMFGNFSRLAKSFPDPSSDTRIEAMQSQLSYLLFEASFATQGPIHINLEFSEPSIDKQEYHFNLQPKTKYTLPTKAPLQNLDAISTLINQSRKALILCGENTFTPHSHSFFHNLFEKINAPIFCDALSGHHTIPKLNFEIPGNDLIFKTDTLTEDDIPDLILHFGGRFVSKGGGPLAKDLYKFLSYARDTPYIHVLDKNQQIDPNHQVTHRVFLNFFEFAEKMAPFLLSNQRTSYLDKLLTLGNSIHEITDQTLNEDQQFSEPLLFKTLSKIDLSGYGMFIGNSLPIRDFRSFFSPKNPLHAVYGNRGLSGIDGNLSTCIGISRASKNRMLCITGDLTFLHDLNALFSLSATHPLITFILINNSGGSIFKTLPIAQKKEICKEYFEVSHSYKLKGDGTDFPCLLL